MIEINKYERLLIEGLSMDHYYVLLCIRDGRKLPDSKRIKGFINLLIKKDYLQKDLSFTAFTTQLLQDEEIVYAQQEVAEEKKVIDFTKWVTELHKKCEERLKLLTGKEQVTAKILVRGKGYPFLPNVTDMGKKLMDVVKKYRLSDMEAIEYCILRHIDNCHKAREWFPLLKYYIMKDGESQLVTEIGSRKKGSPPPPLPPEEIDNVVNI